MSAETLERPASAYIMPMAVPVRCTREECGAWMVYSRHQKPGDGTVTRATSALCAKCYQLSRKLTPFTPGTPPIRRRGMAALKTIPGLLDMGFNANQIADDLGYTDRKSLYTFLRRHNETVLLRRIQSTIAQKG